MCGDPSLPLLPCLSFAAVCAVPVPEGEERLDSRRLNSLQSLVGRY